MLKKLSLNLLNELGNFNEVFGKVVTYDNIKSYKKQGLHPFSRRCIFGKPTGGTQTDTHTF